MPKGIYDRAASRWEPKPKKIYPADLVERVRWLYIDEGMTMAEVADEVGVSRKVLQTLMPRHGIPRRPAVKRAGQRGPHNNNWKGTDAGYTALHLRVQTARGKPDRCECCGRTDAGTKYEWANMTGDYHDVTDYERLCSSCHRRTDNARRRPTGTSTIPKPLRDRR